MLTHTRRVACLLVVLGWIFQLSLASANAAASRIAAGDMPLNLLEIDGRWVVSTNSGWHNAYLQVYDEQQRKVSGHMDLPSAWYGLAYDAKRKLLLASSADSSVYVIAFNQGSLENRENW